MATQKAQNLPPIWERSSEKTFKVHVFVNGDEHRPGKEVTVNKKVISNFDKWLDYLTVLIRPRKGALRRAFTPREGHRLSSLEALKNGDKVVVGCNEDFHKFRYENISPYPRKGQRISYDVEPGRNRRYQVSGRYRKVDTHGTIIRCWANGVDTVGAKPILLPPVGNRPLTKDDVIQCVDAKMCGLCGGPVTRLYLPEGQEVRSVEQIQPNGCYIAVRANDIFKHANYQEMTPKNISTSPRPERRLLPPLSRSTKTSNHSSPEHSISSNNGYRRERAKREEDGVFHARPVKHKRSSEKARQTDYDQDNGGVFKAKSQNRATKGAREVQDSRHTKTEVPVDQRQAEEVKEDVKGKDKKDKKGKKQEENEYPYPQQDQQRTYRANARHADSPGNDQARQEAEREARLRREADDRKRAEKVQQQQDAARRKREDKENQKREEEERRQEEARRRREEVEEERRRREEEEKRWQEEEERNAAEAARRSEHEERRSARDARDSPYRSGTEMLRDEDRRQDRNNQRRTPTPEKEPARGRDSRASQNQDSRYQAEGEMDWGPGLDELRAMEEEERERAATTIQAHYRGMKARQQTRAMRAEREG